MTSSPFNVAFAEARAARGMTVAQLAKATGFTNGMISSYEDVAINPTVRTLFFYCRALGLTVTIDKDGVTIEQANGAFLLSDWVPQREEWPR